MIATQKIKRPTAVLPSLNLTQTANKCENGFFLRTIRFEIFGMKHLKLKNMRLQQSEPYILTRTEKKRSGSSEAVHQAIVIERLLAYSSIFELAMRHCVLGKDILRVFLSHVKATYSLWWSSLTKDLKKKKVVLCVGVVRQTQSA